MADQNLAFVTGATGGVGGEVATALLRHGWKVRALARDPAKASRNAPAAIEYVAGDAMNEADMIAAASGAAIVFHGANPPGYRNWRGLAIPMLRNAIAAAQATGARLVYPGSVYVYGPDAGTTPEEDAPSIRAPARARSGSKWRRCCTTPPPAAYAPCWSAPATSSDPMPRAPG